MTPAPIPSPPSAGAGSPARARPRRPSLYTTVLSLAIAAIAATWLPFSVLYINALSKRPTTVPAISAPATGSHASSTTAALTPVTTRAS